MEKRQRRIFLPALPDSTATFFPAIYELVTPAAVSRQERSDRVTEEASFHHYSHPALMPGSRIFYLSHESLS